MRRLGLMFVLALACIGETGHARTIYFGSETERVTLTAGTPAVFRFPGDVRTITHAERFQIEPANPDSPNYAVLSVRPRVSRGSSDVAFILADGTVVKTRLQVVSSSLPEKSDSIYDFKAKETQLDAGSESSAGTPLPELDLMKAIIRGDEVTGYEVRSVSRGISPGLKGVAIRLIRIYSGGQFNGYIFEIRNVTEKQRLVINVQNMMLGDPNLALLGSVDNAVIEPGSLAQSRTYLRIVAKPTSVYSELKLPIQVAERK